MSALTPQEQLLFDAAKKALPRFLFEEDPSVQEILAAFAKVFALAWDQVALYIDGTRIGTADPTQLDQHAADRGTRRRLNETDESLRARLRFLEDQVTPGAVTAAATRIMEGALVTIPAGYPGLVELRRDRAFFAKLRVLDDVSIALAIANQGTPGITSYSYAVYPEDADGNIIQPAGFTATTTTGAATLNGTDFNRLSWMAYPGAAAYHIFRYASAGTPSSTGKIGTDTASPFDDTGLAGDSLAYTGFGRYAAYLSRGYRMTGSGRYSLEFIIILPYDATQAVADAVAEAVRLIKAGGIGVFVERRLSP